MAHPLDAAIWASEWLGRAWVAADLGDREPEKQLVLEVVGRASSKPSAHGLAAVCALRLAAPPSEHAMLDGTRDILEESFAAPGWAGERPPNPVRAWRAADVWESERALLVEYGGDAPHVLMAWISNVGGPMVQGLSLLETGAEDRWDSSRRPDAVPMPLGPAPVDEVLADLAGAMRDTDMYWPRPDDPDFVMLRALAWTRCRDHLGERPDWEPISDEERRALIEDFVGTGAVPDDDVTRLVSDVIVDYGEGYITAGPLAWSPAEVAVFLNDWLPRKVFLEEADRAALPSVLREWVRFALQRRGVEPRWVDPVVETVDELAPAFAAALDDEAAWGPAKQAVAELTARGVDLSDRAAVDAAVRELNAAHLAESLLPEELSERE